MTRAERVDHVAELMTLGTYKTGADVKRLAALWSLSEANVRQITAEASRRVRTARSMGAPKDIAVCATLDAMQMARKDRDAKALTGAAHEWAMLHGLHAPKRVEAKVTTDCSPEEARARLLELQPLIDEVLK